MKFGGRPKGGGVLTPRPPPPWIRPCIDLLTLYHYQAYLLCLQFKVVVGLELFCRLMRTLFYANWMKNAPFFFYINFAKFLLKNDPFFYMFKDMRTFIKIALFSRFLER